MHKSYKEAMSRKSHRYALLKAAKETPNIDWTFTEYDWTTLKAADTGDAMYVTVRVEIDRDHYFKYREQYERAQRMREAKKQK